jgi:hypothetical protein
MVSRTSTRGSHVAWYVEHREWCDRITQGAYRRERLGPRN